MADKKYISIINNGTENLYIKDAEARQSISDIQSSITGAMHYIGKTTTALSEGATTNPIVIDGNNVTAKAGDVAIYGELEFVFNGTKWQEFGSTGSLKALAFKDNASGNFTPAGSNAASTVTFTGGASGSFVTGYNDDAVAPSFTEGAFTPASLANGFYTAGVAPSYQEGQFTAAQIQSGFVKTAGTAASYSHSGFSGGSLGVATTGSFATEGVTVSYAESTETLTFGTAGTSAAVTAQGTFTPAEYGTDTFTANVPTEIDVTKFSGGSKAADTFTAGSVTTLDLTKFDGGSKAADTFAAGSAATLATATAVTSIGTAEAAAQVFTGTEGTVTVS